MATAMTTTVTDTTMQQLLWTQPYNNCYRHNYTTTVIATSMHTITQQLLWTQLYNNLN